MPRERVLVISLGELAMDSRAQRQLDFLAGDYDVVSAAFGISAHQDGVEFVELPSRSPGSLRPRAESAARAGLRLVGLYDSAYWLDARMRLWRDELKRILPVDAIVVHDLVALPLASAVGGDTPIVYDAQEHWTSESASWTRLQKLSMRGAHEWIVDRSVPQTAAMMTVSPGIARDFERRAGVSPRLVTNAPYFRPLQPSAVSEPIRLLHMGVADERRRLEDTIEAVASLDGRFTLDLVLVRDNDYRHRLEQLAASEPRIRVLRPVPPDEITTFANGYDVGIHLFPARQPNQVHSLPNKFFDYIQARLAVAIGPSPAMAEVVQQWDCGIVSPSFAPEAFAESLRQLTVAEVERLKRNADRAAHVLTAENNRQTVVSLVREAIDGGGSKQQ
jgi:hypothetical protein